MTGCKWVSARCIYWGDLAGGRDMLSPGEPMWEGNNHRFMELGQACLVVRLWLLS